MPDPHPPFLLLMIKRKRRNREGRKISGGYFCWALVRPKLVVTPVLSDRFSSISFGTSCKVLVLVVNKGQAAWFGLAWPPVVCEKLGLKTECTNLKDWS